VKIEDIESTIATHFEAAQGAITAYLQPILQAEFDQVRKQEPRLKRIIFGNGTFVFEFEGGASDKWSKRTISSSGVTTLSGEDVLQADYPDWWRKEEMPEYAHQLWELASIAGNYGTWIEGYIDGDITPKGAEAP
jgi:hypothetical protein